jgi:phage shock protein A
MGILDRIGTLIRANINDLLDRAEDPEKMLDQIIRDMAEAIREAKAQVLSTIAEEKMIEGNLQRARELAEEWRQKAELAVEKGRDDLAREALRRKNDYLSNAQVYERQLAAQREVVAKLKADLQALEAKYEATVRQRDLLVARHKTARAQVKVGEVARAMTAIDPSSELARMEEKIRYEEARAAAQAELAKASLEQQFAELERDDQVEDELQQLKQKMGKA